MCTLTGRCVAIQTIVCFMMLQVTLWASPLSSRGTDFDIPLKELKTPGVKEFEIPLSDLKKGEKKAKKSDSRGHKAKKKTEPAGQDTPQAAGPAEDARKPVPSATAPAEDSRKPVPAASVPAKDSQKPAPSATIPADTSQKPVPSASVPEKDSQKPAPSASVPAEDSRKPAPSAVTPAKELPTGSQVPQLQAKPEKWPDTTAAVAGKAAPAADGVSISHDPYSYVVTGKRTIIYAVVISDPDELRSVQCRFRAADTAGFAQVSMTKVVGTSYTYTATLPALSKGAGPLRYMLVTVDTMNRETRSREFRTPVRATAVVPGWQLEPSGDKIRVRVENSGKPFEGFSDAIVVDTGTP